MHFGVVWLVTVLIWQRAVLDRTKPTATCAKKDCVSQFLKSKQNSHLDKPTLCFKLRRTTSPL